MGTAAVGGSTFRRFTLALFARQAPPRRLRLLLWPVLTSKELGDAPEPLEVVYVSLEDIILPRPTDQQPELHIRSATRGVVRASHHQEAGCSFCAPQTEGLRVLSYQRTCHGGPLRKPLRSKILRSTALGSRPGRPTTEIASEA